MSDLFKRDVIRADLEAVGDDVIKIRLERLQPGVIDLWKIEVVSRGPVRGNLRARDQRTIKTLKDQCIEDVQICMQLAHQPSEFAIDLRPHLCAGGTCGMIEIVPGKTVFLQLDANYMTRSPRPVEDAPIM